MSLARVETLISGYRAWMCAILGLFLAHSQPVIPPFSSYRSQTQDVTISDERVRMGDRIEEILGRNRLSLRKGTMGRKKRRRALILCFRDFPWNRQKL